MAPHPSRVRHQVRRLTWHGSLPRVPEPQGVWQYRQSISVMQQLVNHRMYPLTIKGLEEAMRLLVK